MSLNPILIAAPILSVVLIVVGYGFLRYPTAAEAQREIMKATSIGMSEAQVVSYLNKQDIENSGYDPQSRQILALSRRIRSHSLLVASSLQIRFTFDDSQRLLSSDFEEKLTGP